MCRLQRERKREDFTKKVLVSIQEEVSTTRRTTITRKSLLGMKTLELEAEGDRQNKKRKKKA